MINENNMLKVLRQHSLIWLIALSFFIFHLSFSPARAQIGSWRTYMSYYEPQQIVKAGSNTLFVRASNSLYSYNLTDHSITTYDKVNPLSDTYISYIAWNQQAKRLIIVYQNGTVGLASKGAKPEPGCEIIVPSKKQRNPINFGALLSAGTSLASLATMVVALTKL